MNEWILFVCAIGIIALIFGIVIKVFRLRPIATQEVME